MRGRRAAEGRRRSPSRTAERLKEDLADEALREELRPLLDRSLPLVAHAETARTVETSVLSAFAHENGALVVRATDHATRLQLDALETLFLEAFDGLEEERRPTLRVVVGGDRRSDERCLGMQYFQARLGEASGEEKRVFFAEGVGTLEEAVAFLSARRIERALAGAFFGDPRRLPRKVEEAAVAAMLEELKLPPL